MTPSDGIATLGTEQTRETAVCQNAYTRRTPKTGEQPVSPFGRVLAEVQMPELFPHRGGRPTTETTMRRRAHFLELVAGGMRPRAAWKMSKASPGDIIDLLADPVAYAAQVRAVRASIVAELEDVAA